MRRAVVLHCWGEGEEAGGLRRARASVPVCALVLRGSLGVSSTSDQIKFASRNATRPNARSTEGTAPAIVVVAVTVQTEFKREFKREHIKP